MVQYNQEEILMTRKRYDEYGVATPTIRVWVIIYNDSKSFDVDDNITEEEKN